MPPGFAEARRAISARLSFELRTGMSLARLWAASGRCDNAWTY